MHDHIEEILFTREQIAERVKELGKQITEDYRGKPLTCVCLLKGGVFFMADLLKEIDLPLTTDFMDVSSYGAGTVSSGEVRILKDLSHSIKGRDVLIVEDIVDTGLTLDCVIELLETREANSVEVVSFLSKEERREIDIDIKYYGYKIDDYFVVGYGLDFDEEYRNLPYIGYLKEEMYK